jgi:hypothetical protein
MDIYHIWCNVKQDVLDLDFTRSATQYLDHLKQSGDLIEYRITRRKLGLGPVSLGEFHLMLEFSDLNQLDNAFQQVASRADPVESFHHAVNSKVLDVTFALYRDFPDKTRQQGEEKF